MKLVIVLGLIALMLIAQDLIALVISSTGLVLRSIGADPTDAASTGAYIVFSICAQKAKD